MNHYTYQIHIHTIPHSKRVQSDLDLSHRSACSISIRNSTSDATECTHRKEIHTQNARYTHNCDQIHTNTHNDLSSGGPRGAASGRPLASNSGGAWACRINSVNCETSRLEPPRADGEPKLTSPKEQRECSEPQHNTYIPRRPLDALIHIHQPHGDHIGESHEDKVHPSH